MGLFDIFGGGTPAERAAKLKPKVTQKYGEAQNRQKAISDLIKLHAPETLPVLMQRFTFTVDPQTTDRMEKDEVFQAVVDLGDDAVPYVTEFLKKNDQASSWALKILASIVSEDKVIEIATAELTRLGAEYTRDPEKKEVLLHLLAEKSDARIGPVVLPFLRDMSDDVKMAAIKTVAAVKEPTAREPLLQLLTEDETAKRVQTACIEALHAAAFTVQGYREKVEAKLSDPWHLDKQGQLKKRGQ